ncbi:HNH endonuclease signature motif containing protein [Rhodococcus globerulus]|uniref:HNH endonuclease n=1 Tax=Rhodococcus globerulus TaxID=33008 RepID=UPI0030196907
MATRRGEGPRRSAAMPISRGPGARLRNDPAGAYDPRMAAELAEQRAARRPTPEQSSITAAKRAHWSRIKHRMTPLVFAHYGNLCWLCQRVEGTTVDHVLALSKGGSVDDLANLRPCCSTCNYARGDRDPEVFRATLRAKFPQSKPSRNWFG